MQVLFNILKAHAAAYKAMKSIPGAEDIQIGLVHHHVEFMPTSPTYWWVKPLAWWGTFWWGRDTVLRFLQTGHFEWWVPLWGRSAPPPSTHLSLPCAEPYWEGLPCGRAVRGRAQKTQVIQCEY